MNDLLTQRTRYLLRSRFRSVQVAPIQSFPSAVRHLLTWLDGHPAFAPTLSVLRAHQHATRGESEKMSNFILDDKQGGITPTRAQQDSRDTRAAIAVEVLDCLCLVEHITPDRLAFFLACIHEYLFGDDLTRRIHNTNELADASLESCNDHVCDFLFEYLDEQVDGANAIFLLVSKYKQRSEAFHGSRLRRLASDGHPEHRPAARPGERALAADLTEYLFEQGVDFTLEAKSPSGQSDFILRDPDGGRLALDAKYLPPDVSPSKARRTLAAGFQQVARYCHDYACAHGYLVVYNESVLTIQVELQQQGTLRWLSLAGKTIYYEEVLIGEMPTASRAGRATSVQISPAELAAEVKDEEAEG